MLPYPVRDKNTLFHLCDDSRYFLILYRLLLHYALEQSLRHLTVPPPFAQRMLVSGQIFACVTEFLR